MSKFKKLVAVTAVLVLALSMALVGCSGGKKLIKDGVLVVGSDCDYPPFIILDGDKPVGFEMDLMQAIADDLGYELEYLPPQNFDTLLTTLAGGAKMDIAVSSLTITEDRAKSVDFCKPYFDSNQACVVRGDSPYTKAKDLEGKVVGAQSGTTGEAWANEHLEGITMKPFNQTSEGLMALQAGEIEALFFDAPIAEYHLATNYPTMKIAEVIPTGEQYGFAVRKGNKDLLEEINASLDRLIADGTYEKIFKKYFPNLEPSVN
ncbi:MAG: basic amino acid ABC transporter substrate-binding protein [Coriobacteriia bacterium]|nr:basic amino acid ABC transporter substrate-binding protein [Coriobacteriia bacterium]